MNDWILSALDVQEDYCLEETFSPSCNTGTVIQMKSALFGRMKKSPCGEADFGFIGCFADVLHKLDWLCSGRRGCHITVLRSVFETDTSCKIDLGGYLSVTYECTSGNIKWGLFVTICYEKNLNLICTLPNVILYYDRMWQRPNPFYHYATCW